MNEAGSKTNQPSATDTQVLDIEGMSCNNCATTVTKFLEREGLEDVRVDFTSGKARFRSPKPLNGAALATGISKLGYRVKSTDAAVKQFDHEKRLLVVLLISAACTAPLLLHMIPGFTFLHNAWLQFALTVPPLIVGLLYFGKNSLGAFKVRVLHMDVLVLIGVVSAFAYSVYGTLVLKDMNYMFFETAASIVTLVLLGHFIEHRAVRKTRQAVKDLQALMPETAERINFYGNAKFEVHETVTVEKIQANDFLLVRSGDKIAADGEVVWGNGAVAEELLTGEAEPQPKQAGDHVLAGSVMTNGSVKMKVTAAGNDTVIASIVQLVNDTKAAKPSIQRLADKITTVFVPVVLAIALVTFLANHFLFDVGLSESVMRAVAVLVISCPCAMGLATPTAVVVGLGIAARKGILIKDANVLELMPKLKKVMFDKTGTLTSGHFEVTDVRTNPESLAELRQVIGALEKHSSHPIAKSLL
ncbi:MAG TPA: cation-translocating P-type ATPase, partial [Chitinophagales bacterium]|nr:cation-translocating P-type ATPase [Chitinophagales bacterium]